MPATSYQRQMLERTYGPFVHMAPEDTSIWLRYLEAGGGINAPFSYDVRVGNGVTMPEGSSSFAIKSAAALTTKRIDVMWNDGPVPVICEIKKRAGATAIGQLVLYRNLWVAQFPNGQTPRLFLLTDELQPDVLPTLIEFNISYLALGL
jgi:hypothetical protein